MFPGLIERDESLQAQKSLPAAALKGEGMAARRKAAVAPLALALAFWLFAACAVAREVTKCSDIGKGDLSGGTCTVNADVQVTNEGLTISGSGNLSVDAGVTISVDCGGLDGKDCDLSLNMGGFVLLGENAVLTAPTIDVVASSLDLQRAATIDASGLSTSDTGSPYDPRDGAGYGGTGATCDSTTDPSLKGACYGWGEDFRGVSDPFVGGWGSASAGNGGGRIHIKTTGDFVIAGSVTADGVGPSSGEGGGGSGGSITIEAGAVVDNSTDTSSLISACGGPGVGGGNHHGGGGGGGRVAILCTSSLDSNINMAAAGGLSSENCTINGNKNNGAAGTLYIDVGGVRELHISNNDEKNGRLLTMEKSLLGIFPEHLTLDKFSIQEDAVVEMPTTMSSTEVVAREVELIDSASLTFGDGQNSGNRLNQLHIMSDTFSMSDSLMDIDAGSLKYEGLNFGAGAFNLTDASRIEINTGSERTTSKVLGSLSITGGSSLISNGKLYMSPLYSSATSTVNLGGFHASPEDSNVLSGAYLTFMGYANITVGPSSQMVAPCTPSISKMCTNYLGCSSTGAVCPTDENPCGENTEGFWTMSFCKVSKALRVFGGLVDASNIFVSSTASVVIEGQGQMLANFGCAPDTGPGNGTGNSINGAGGGAGHGGYGGNGTAKNTTAFGGRTYGSGTHPCENGSGGGSGEQSGGRGGGSILMGSLNQPINNMYLDGILMADGQSTSGSGSSMSGGGGGSGGSILLYLREFEASNEATVTARGGNATLNGGGGGGGGRIHFDWSKDSHVWGSAEKVASGGYCKVSTAGGQGHGLGKGGGIGTATTVVCPKGRSGLFCSPCPHGTYKDKEGYLLPCKPCQGIPKYANYTTGAGGTSFPCPYQCHSSHLRSDCTPNINIIIDWFGGTLGFVVSAWALVFVIALFSTSLKAGFIQRAQALGIISEKKVMRQRGPLFTPGGGLSVTSPLLESLDEVLINEQANARQTYEDFTVRVYFQGTGSLHEPWNLQPVPHPQLKRNMIIESEFVEFVNTCNEITLSEKLHQVGFYSLVKILCPPIAWEWKNKHRKDVIDELKYYIESEEGHRFLRSARARALLDVLRFGHSQDLTIAYFDVYSTLHEQDSANRKQKKMQPESILHQKLPLLMLFSGEGSFLSPYKLQPTSADFTQQFLCECISPLVWTKLAQDLNQELQGVLRSTLEDDLAALEKFVEKGIGRCLHTHGLRATLHYSCTVQSPPQIGLLIEDLVDNSLNNDVHQNSKNLKQYFLRKQKWHYSFGMPAVKKFLFCAHHSFSGTRVQASLGLCVFVLLVVDGCLTLFILMEMFQKKEVLVLSLLIPPLAILGAPVNGMFGLLTEKPSALRVHNVWNLCSMISVLVIIIGKGIEDITDTNTNAAATEWYHDDSKFFILLPAGLFVEKLCQLLIINIFTASRYHLRHLN